MQKSTAYLLSFACPLISLASAVALAAEANGDVRAGSNSPVVITAGEYWIPLHSELDIEPGSALDFTGIAGTDSPAGKHGPVIARPDGQFAFAGRTSSDAPSRPTRRSRRAGSMV